MSQEKTPLLGSPGENYYFTSSDKQNGGEEVELPKGDDDAHYQPKQIGKGGELPLSAISESQSTAPRNGFWSKFTGNGVKKSTPAPLKQRKAPIKVEPKVFFANERTFLAWMHISIILAGASIAILAFSDDSVSKVSVLYGIVTLPVAVAFIAYSVYQYVRRAYMIRNKHPGPYDDTVGPTVLTIMLMLSIACQFAIKLYSISH